MVDKDVGANFGDSRLKPSEAWLAAFCLKTAEMPHPTALFELSVMRCQGRLKISRVNNIGNVSELSGVAFRLPRLLTGFLLCFTV